MRTEDVRLGETYQVRVPERLPPGLRRHVPADRAEFAADLRLHTRRGSRFDLTVTAVTADGLVDGVEDTHTTRVAISLTPDQAAGLGLAPGDYRVDGYLTDDQNKDVPLPIKVIHSRLPAAWLRPLADPVPIAPARVRHVRGRVQSHAAGRAAAEVDRAAGAALEHRRAIAESALDSYRAEGWLRTAEVEYAEWQRIFTLLTETKAEVYDPADDPERIDPDART